MQQKIIGIIYPEGFWRLTHKKDIYVMLFRDKVFFAEWLIGNFGQEKDDIEMWNEIYDDQEEDNFYADIYCGEQKIKFNALQLIVRDSEGIISKVNIIPRG